MNIVKESLCGRGGGKLPGNMKSNASGVKFRPISRPQPRPDNHPATFPAIFPAKCRGAMAGINTLPNTAADVPDEKSMLFSGPTTPEKSNRRNPNQETGPINAGQEGGPIQIHRPSGRKSPTLGAPSGQWASPGNRNISSLCSTRMNAHRRSAVLAGTSSAPRVPGALTADAVRRHAFTGPPTSRPACRTRCLRAGWGRLIRFGWFQFQSDGFSNPTTHPREGPANQAHR